MTIVRKVSRELEGKWGELGRMGSGETKLVNVTSRVWLWASLVVE